MRKLPILAGTIAVALVPTAAVAQKPQKPQKPTNPPTAPTGGNAVSVNVSRTVVQFPGSVFVSGAVIGKAPLGGVEVTLEQDDTKPYGDSFKPAGQKKDTTADGRYIFTVKPARNTQYRVTAKASPTVTSRVSAVVQVRPFVGIKASNRFPAAGRFVRFSGLVRPARNGAVVQLQRRSATGSFVTVARDALSATTGGSLYSVRVRVRRSGTYRVKLASNAEFTNGFSKLVRLTVR